MEGFVLSGNVPMRATIPDAFRLWRPLALLFAGLVLAACQTPRDESTPEPAAEAARPGVVSRREQGRSRVRTNAAPGLERPLPAMAEAATPAPVTDLWQRLRDGFALSAHYHHPSVDAALADYASDPALYALVSERARYYLYDIVSELEHRGMPLELALLPVVESTFDPEASSREGAVGLWQIVGDTARRFDLQLDWWYDGRRDVPASTRAALDYLTLLNERFDGDWLLTLAAYNAGGGNVSRAIRRSGQSDADVVDFWTLPLARETLVHVPRLLALSRVVAEPDRHGIELPALPNSNPLARIEVGAQIDLLEAARLSGLPYETLRALNTGYRQWATHPDQPQYLYLPADTAPLFEERLATVDPQSLVTWGRYEIRSGDTLGAIARRFDTDIAVLQQVNGLDGSRIIAGDSLLIPRGSLSGVDLAVPVLASSRPRESVPDSYTVRNGDNLWSIARRFDLRSADIARHNGISLDSTLRPGQRLDLGFAATAAHSGEDSPPQGPSATAYRVRAGDTLGRIARTFDISLEQLLAWNSLSSSDPIFPGQQLRIRPPATGP